MGQKNKIKKFEKISKKVLTFEEYSGILTKLSRRAAAGTGHWKQNNKRGTHFYCRKYNVVRNSQFFRVLYNSKKVKELQKLWIIKVLATSVDNIQFFREFDPGSGWTLAACLTHSSRTVTGTSVPWSVADGWVTREQPAFQWGITQGNLC